MNLNETCLTAGSLRRLATNEFSPDQLQQLEHHVDHCPRCLELLQRDGSDRWLEDSAIELLKSSDTSPFSTCRDDEFPSAISYDSILKMLGPTDDPHRLGRVDAYEIVGIIGRGGMGVVFKAFDPGLQRFVAIKMLLPHLAESAAARKRFAREAKAAAAVVDDYVLPIHGVSEWRGVPYIVSQYCRGETLQKRIETVGTLEVKEILRISLQIARGLAAAHAQGLVHRDIKPANILLDQGVERVQITDFGLARAIDDASMTRTGVLAGTPQFMSPEQARGATLDGRSDLFALGSVMYTMCTGRPPFRRSQALAVLQKITQEKHKPVQALNADIPQPLSQLIDHLLEKEVDDRFPSAHELATWLESYLSHLQQPTVQTKPRLPRSRRRMKKLRAAGLASAMCFAALVATPYGLTFDWSRGSVPSENAKAQNSPGIVDSESSDQPAAPPVETRALRLARLIEAQEALISMERIWVAHQTETRSFVEDPDHFRRKQMIDQDELPGVDVVTLEILQLKTMFDQYEQKYLETR